jgi:hypothetical protein
MGDFVSSTIYALIDLVNGIASAVIGLLADHGIDLFPALGLIAFVALVVQFAL